VNFFLFFSQKEEERDMDSYSVCLVCLEKREKRDGKRCCLEGLGSYLFLLPPFRPRAISHPSPGVCQHFTTHIFSFSHQNRTKKIVFLSFSRFFLIFLEGGKGPASGNFIFVVVVLNEKFGRNHTAVSFSSVEFNLFFIFIFHFSFSVSTGE
jgi:hypothetical protein